MGKFAAIDPVGFTSSLLVLRGDIGWVCNDAVNALFLQTIMCPEAGETCFIDSTICRAREIAFQVTNKHADIRRLGKGLMFKLIGQDADTPTFFMNVHADIKMLTREIKFANVVHGKSPFGFICVRLDSNIP
jgi:hypothetical protein